MRTLAITLFLAAAVPALAERVPSAKAPGFRTDGVRGDITVPYLTNGRSTLGVYNGVGPLIYAAPQLGSPAAPIGQNVYNLPFYGARLGASSGIVGATEQAPIIIRFRR
ncbi:MAG: hypothetical protein K2W96_05600 [Gemmataceae bacterium]|nr:hypothetical protein [Gemmataceae bacterium]